MKIQKKDCINQRPDEPELYIAWHDWAARMGKTHYQEQCPCCGLWTIWKPKK